jgi:hypothetical protein
MLLLENYDFYNYFSFECNTSDHSVVGWSYEDGKVTLKVDYLTDLEDQEVRVVFSFNQLFIRRTPVTLGFTAQSDTLPLIYEVETSSFITASYLYLSAAGISLLVLIISSPVSKMLGI